MNALNKELHVGDVVVAKRRYVKGSVKDLRMVIRGDSFGLSPNTMGRALYVTWMDDLSEDRWEGDMIDKKASEKAQEEITKDPTYGWLFKIVKTLQANIEWHKQRNRRFQEKIDTLTEQLKKSKRTRVVAVYSMALSSDDGKFEVDVLRSDGVLRIYHVTDELNVWLYKQLTHDVESVVWDNNPRKNNHGRIRLYP